MKTKITPEGSKFISSRFDEIDTPKKWLAAFRERYASLPAKFALAFATRDFKEAK